MKCNTGHGVCRTATESMLVLIIELVPCQKIAGTARLLGQYLNEASSQENVVTKAGNNSTLG